MPIPKTKTKIKPVGVCRVCACTHQEGCPEGCEWVDRTKSLCSVCAHSTDAEIDERRAEAIQTLDMEISVARDTLRELKFRRSFIVAAGRKERQEMAQARSRR